MGKWVVFGVDRIVSAVPSQTGCNGGRFWNGILWFLNLPVFYVGLLDGLLDGLLGIAGIIIDS